MLNAVLIFVGILVALFIGIGLVWLVLDGAEKREQVFKAKQTKELEAKMQSLCHQAEKLEKMREQGF